MNIGMFDQNNIFVMQNISDKYNDANQRIDILLCFMLYPWIRFWRNNGIAFTWIEGEPARSNPTLLNNIIPVGDGFLHYAYLGDITNGPFFTWALNENKENM